jgi:hypothetical protein
MLFRTGTRVARASTAVKRAASGLVELREYVLKPDKAAAYLAATQAAAGVRHEHVPTRLCSVPETGGQLHIFTHWYSYADHSARDAARAGMPKDPRWVDYLNTTRPCVESQSSTIFVEAPLVEAFGLHGLKNAACPSGGCDSEGDPIYELRRYQLRLGYDTVPAFMAHYESGLPSKLAAPGTHPSTSLCSVLFSDIGSLNEVFEIWRHGAGTAGMMQSREAARGAKEWKACIASIAELAISFRSTVHKPLGDGLSKWV